MRWAALVLLTCIGCAHRSNIYVVTTKEVNGMATFFDKNGDAIIFIEAKEGMNIQKLPISAERQVKDIGTSARDLQ